MLEGDVVICGHVIVLLRSMALFNAVQSYVCEARGYVSDYVSGLQEMCTDLCEAINTKIPSYQRTPERTDAAVRPSIKFVAIKYKGSEKPRDDVRRLNEMLCHECAQAQEEYKRLRGVVDQLEREYESSKDVDMIRRYGMLKGMIKRSVMHLKVTNEEHQQVQATCGKQKEENRKREEHITGLSKEEITKENDELQEQTKEYKRKISMTKDLIEQMEHNYENSKRFIAVQRYRLMKTMIKTVIHNKWI